MAVVQWEIRRHQVAISGRVVNAASGQPVANALVNITSAAVQAATRTGADGHFHCLDLANGSYLVHGSLPEEGTRYGIAQVTVSVSRDGEGNIQRATTELQLPATVISGRISQSNNQPIVMAEIALQGSGEKTFSDADGEYALIGVETGTRTLRIRAQGFDTAVETVALTSSGSTVTADVILTPG